MANVAITDLSEAVSVNSNDVLPLVNVGANITQKVTANTLKTFVGVSGNLTGNLEGNGFGANNLAFVNTIGNITAGNITTTGRLVAAGATMNSTLNMNNSSITNINGLQIADSGRNEGITWNDTNQWAIFDSPNDFTNFSGNLQFTTGNTADAGNTSAYKRITFNTLGQVEIPVATGTAPLKVNSTTKVTNLNADLLNGFATSQSNSANTVVVRTGSGGIVVASISMSSLTGATVSATGNITGANIITGGQVSATGAITTAGQLRSTVATGTAPMTVSSTTQVNNLNAQYLQGRTPSTTNAADTIVARSASGAITVGAASVVSVDATSFITAGGNLIGNLVIATTATQLKVYANTAVRDSAISSPTPGMMVYVTGVGMQVRGATAWNTIAGSGT